MHTLRAVNDQSPLRVVIAGAGVAGLEAALALRELAGDRVSTTLLTPEREFVYRPLRVREPFAYAAARRHPLDAIARDVAAELREDALDSVDTARQVVLTEGAQRLGYDALLLALGAQPVASFEHALTLDDRRLDEQLHGLIQDVEAGYTHTIAFLIPGQAAWPLPIYELALMTARRAWDMNVEVSITIVTPEEAPLAIFGGVVSETVAELLDRHGLATITSAHCETPAPGEVSIRPGPRQLRVDRVIALPELRGPVVPGVPSTASGGFIPVDVHGRVPGLEGVYAAGDAVDFPVKQGGIAAQQADIAAESIAALAGAAVEPSEFHPIIQGVLIGGPRPLYMRAHITGGHGSSSDVSEDPSWRPSAKIAARYLSPYLDARDRAAVR
jgi:sulfide:quinone oxidoreductase